MLLAVLELDQEGVQLLVDLLWEVVGEAVEGYDVALFDGLLVVLGFVVVVG